MCKDNFASEIDECIRGVDVQLLNRGMGAPWRGNARTKARSAAIAQLGILMAVELVPVVRKAQRQVIEQHTLG